MESNYTQSQIERFWRKVKKTADPNECWIWTGAKGRGNYGVLHFSRKNLRCHRVAYELTFGDIPDGLQVCHTCDNPPCVNPFHLFLGTAKDNCDDKMQKGRYVFPPPLSHENGTKAKLTEKQVEEIRKRYIPGVVSQRQLGKEFGVNQTTIKEIIKRRTWK